MTTGVPILAKIDRALPPWWANNYIKYKVNEFISEKKFWNAQAFSSYFHKMATIDHFGFPISSHIDRKSPTLGHEWPCQK